MHKERDQLGPQDSTVKRIIRRGVSKLDLINRGWVKDGVVWVFKGVEVEGMEMLEQMYSLEEEERRPIIFASNYPSVKEALKGVLYFGSMLPDPGLKAIARQELLYGNAIRAGFIKSKVLPVYKNEEGAYTMSEETEVETNKHLSGKGSVWMSITGKTGKKSMDPYYIRGGAVTFARRAGGLIWPMAMEVDERGRLVRMAISDKPVDPVLIPARLQRHYRQDLYNLHLQLAMVRIAEMLPDEQRGYFRGRDLSDEERCLTSEIEFMIEQDRD